MISHTAGLRCFRSGPDSRQPLRPPRPAFAAAALLVAACQITPPPPAAPPSIKTITQARFEPVAVGALPAIADADLVAAWPALLQSCRGFERNAARRPEWQVACRHAAAAPTHDAAALRALLARHFDAYRVLSVTLEDGTTEPKPLASDTRGRITGYYEPLLNGSRARGAPYVVPLHRRPDDLLIIDLSSLRPELANLRLRGRLQPGENGLRVLPYWARAELTEERLRGAELLWVDDAIEAFFLQIQGSGRVRLPDGSMVRVGYADTNGHPYQSIGRILVERGELTLEQASLQGIAAWARANPLRVDELLNQNPSYVFFRELPLGDPQAGPLGAMGLPLTPGYSVAVDPRFIPLGAPLLIATAHPLTGEPLQRLLLAQDVGGAIRGPLRFDLFWGFGAEAAAAAGRQRGEAQAWLLVPRGVAPESLLGR
jgi:membrane-bound lytic murein transglycosylase A